MKRPDARPIARSTAFARSTLCAGLGIGVVLGVAAGPAHAQFGFRSFSPQQQYQNPYQNQYQSPFQSPFQYQRPVAPRPQAPAQPAAPRESQTELPRATSAPYDHDLQRLTEILGALHFLRGICGTDEGPKWRNEAQALIDAEAPAGDRHDAMISSFNRGYRGFQQSYRTCTPAADVAIRRYLGEGAKIAREITARYAN